ncbi:DUF4198 domain-containing protein [Roseovarius aestuarii]|uniref:DUF4198 domain-containing protein n=1 Tax=Roseovarius aestuarii TaxID=475083 RepID=UPI000A26F905|nr:DUF4198 domain-containing protein [Roseovarius aestuarii]
MFNRSLLLALWVCCPIAATAHEFWLDPIEHILPSGKTVEAHLKVGQNYSGSTFPFLPSRFESFTVTGPTGTHDIDGTIGDLPAAQLSGLPEGLHILAYASTTDRLKFDDWELFNTYVAYEGNDWAVAAHIAAGLPRTGFIEGYRRYAKSLVQVGAVRAGDADQELGLAIELIALASPYALPPGQDTLPVQLFWQGAPLAQQRINVFHLAGETTLTPIVTDENGQAMVPIGHAGRYLLNAVHMELNDADTDLAWNSHWASLTFEIGTPD